MNPKGTLLQVIALFIAAGCSTVHRFDSTKVEIINVPDGIARTNVLSQVAQNVTNGLPAVFKVASGERIPLKLNIMLPMGTLETNENTFAFNRDTYFLISKKRGLELSPDGQLWASIASPKGLAKVFGFKHGEVSFGFTSSTNEKPFMQLNAKVH